MSLVLIVLILALFLYTLQMSPKANSVSAAITYTRTQVKSRLVGYKAIHRYAKLGTTYRGWKFKIG